MRIFFVAVALALVWVRPAWALEAVMEVTGAVQGAFEAGGNGVDLGPSRQFTVLSYSHSATRPLNDKTDMPTEPRSQGAFKFTKYVDRSTPRFWQAFLSNEPLRCVMRLTQQGLDGEPELFYTVELSGARVKKISEHLPKPASRGNGVLHTQTISLVFTRISWTHNGASITALDSLR